MKETDYSFSPQKLYHSFSPWILESVFIYNGATFACIRPPFPCIWSLRSCCFSWCWWICSRNWGESEEIWFCGDWGYDCRLACWRLVGDESLICVGELKCGYGPPFCLPRGDEDNAGLDGESKPWSKVIPESRSVSNQEFCVRFFGWCTWGAAIVTIWDRIVFD